MHQFCYYPYVVFRQPASYRENFIIMSNSPKACHQYCEGRYKQQIHQLPQVNDPYEGDEEITTTSTKLFTKSTRTYAQELAPVLIMPSTTKQNNVFFTYGIHKRRQKTRVKRSRRQRSWDNLR